LNAQATVIEFLAQSGCENNRGTAGRGPERSPTRLAGRVITQHSVLGRLGVRHLGWGACGGVLPHQVHATRSHGNRNCLLSDFDFGQLTAPIREFVPPSWLVQNLRSHPLHNWGTGSSLARLYSKPSLATSTLD